jgi:hypothetical protein
MVTILDRTGEHQEIEYDKRIYTFRGKATQVLPLEVATWLFRSQNPRHWVHTTDGAFVRRYGVTDAPEDWVTELGADVLETSALTRDAQRQEGWDAEAVDPLRARTTRTLDLTTTAARPRRDDYVNQAAGATGR